MRFPRVNSFGGHGGAKNEKDPGDFPTVASASTRHWPRDSGKLVSGNSESPSSAIRVSELLARRIRRRQAMTHRKTCRGIDEVPSPGSVLLFPPKPVRRKLRTETPVSRTGDYRLTRDRRPSKAPPRNESVSGFGGFTARMLAGAPSYRPNPMARSRRSTNAPFCPGKSIGPSPRWPICGTTTHSKPRAY